jgi:hypothetical protein
VALAMDAAVSAASITKATSNPPGRRPDWIIKWGGIFFKRVIGVRG